MKKCKVYDDETLGLYLDGELEAHAMEAVERHLGICSHCRSVVQNYETLALTFKQGVERRAPWDANPLSQQTVFPGVEHLQQSFGAGIIDFLEVKKNLLQLVSIAAILIAGIFYYPAPSVLQDGPSAIINFVEGDMASVMIFETHPSNHTIIWYTEG